MKTGDLIYVRYIGNIRHWKRDLFQAPITWVGLTHFTVTIDGQVARFEKATLRHENRGNPAYQLFPSVAAYEQDLERSALKKLMSSTDFSVLPVEKQRAIKAILEA